MATTEGSCQSNLDKHYMRFAVKLASPVATDNPPYLLQGLFCQASLKVTSLAMFISCITDDKEERVTAQEIILHK